MLFAVSALAALSLIAPSAGFAQGAYNQLGLYLDQAGDPNTAEYTGIGSQFTAYLVLTNPVNEAYNDGQGTPPYERPMDLVSGFELQIVFPTGATFFKLSQAYNGQGLNIGTEPDFIVGYSTPVPVTDGAVWLMSFTMLPLDGNPREIFFGTSSVPSLPGVMAVADGSIENDNLQAVYPSSGDLSLPVFGVNTGVVATEAESWGSVKSLFR